MSKDELIRRIEDALPYKSGGGIVDKLVMIAEAYAYENRLKSERMAQLDKRVKRLENCVEMLMDKSADTKVKSPATDEQKVKQCLQLCNGHRASAAKMLGVSERTMYRLIQKYEK